MQVITGATLIDGTGRVPVEESAVVIENGRFVYAGTQADAPIPEGSKTIDASGKLLKVTTIATADELASSSELVTAKSINVPAAIIRGVDYSPEPGGIGVLIRDRSRDLFR